MRQNIFTYIVILVCFTVIPSFGQFRDPVIQKAQKKMMAKKETLKTINVGDELQKRSFISVDSSFANIVKKLATDSLKINDLSQADTSLFNIKSFKKMLNEGAQVGSNYHFDVTHIVEIKNYTQTKNFINIHYSNDKNYIALEYVDPSYNKHIVIMDTKTNSIVLLTELKSGKKTKQSLTIPNKMLVATAMDKTQNTLSSSKSKATMMGLKTEKYSGQTTSENVDLTAILKSMVWNKKYPAFLALFLPASYGENQMMDTNMHILQYENSRKEDPTVKTSMTVKKINQKPFDINPSIYPIASEK